MKTSTVETWAWVLLYGGLLLLCVAIFAWRGSAAVGGWLLGAGLAGSVGGILLIIARSRMRGDPPPGDAP